MQLFGYKVSLFVKEGYKVTQCLSLSRYIKSVRFCSQLWSVIGLFEVKMFSPSLHGFLLTVEIQAGKLVTAHNPSLQ